MIFSMRMNGKTDALVQDGLKISRQAMQNTGMRYMEFEIDRSRIVTVSRR